MENTLIFRKADFRDGFLALVSRLQSINYTVDWRNFGGGLGGLDPLDPILQNLTEDELKSLDFISYAFTSDNDTPVISKTSDDESYIGFSEDSILINLDNSKAPLGELATLHNVCMVLCIWMKDKGSSRYGIGFPDILGSCVQIKPGIGYAIDGYRFNIDGFSDDTAESDKFKILGKVKRTLSRNERVALLR